MGGLLPTAVCKDIYKKAVNAPEIVDRIDLNDYTDNINVFTRNDCTNTPSSIDWWYVEVIRFVDQRYILQRATSPGSSPIRVYVRCRIDGQWNPWVMLL